MPYLALLSLPAKGQMQSPTSPASSKQRFIPLTDSTGGYIADVVRALRSHLSLLLACTCLSACSSLLYLSITKSVYQGSAVVRIDPSRAGSLGLNDLATQGNVEADSEINTEIAVIKSDGVALRTLRSLPDAEFASYTGTAKAQAGLPEHLESLSTSQHRLLERAKSSIDAKQIVGTSLINVTVRSTDPKLAAIVVNTLVKAYTIQSFTSRDNSVSELRTWLSAQMQTLRQEVDVAQSKLASFQEANNLLGTEGASNTITDRLQILNQSLATAEADRIGKESRLRAASTANPSTLLTLFPDPNLTALQTSQGDLYVRYAELSAKFGPQYPPLEQLYKQLSSVNSEIARTADTIRQRLRQEYEAAKTNESMLQEQYKNQTALAYGANRNQAEYAVLQGEISSSRELYDLLRRKMQQASIDADVNGLNTVLVDGSTVPLAPIEPKRLLILAGSIILGLFAGIVAALTAEAMSDTIRSADQVERVLHVPALGMIPIWRSTGDVKLNPLATLTKPHSALAEAYRGFRNAILFSLPARQSTTLVVGTTLPDDGLNIVVANLAVALAQTGVRVLVVDADLRSPSIHKAFQVSNYTGLTTLFSEPSTVVPFQIPIKDLPALSVLTAGPATDFPAEKLASGDLHSRLTEWRLAYDYVIVKAAPFLVVGDSLALASWSDAVLLVSHFGETSIPQLSKAINILNRNGAVTAGVLIKDVSSSAMDHRKFGNVNDVYFAEQGD